MKLCLLESISYLQLLEDFLFEYRFFDLYNISTRNRMNCGLLYEIIFLLLVNSDRRTPEVRPTSLQFIAVELFRSVRT